jgi:polysaccharide biosynthesis transport protein
MESPQGKLIRVDKHAGIQEVDAYYMSEPVPLAQEPDAQTQAHLFDYWSFLVKRCWIVVTALLAVLILTGVNTWQQTPIYRASLKLQIDVEQPNILPFKDYASPDFTYIPTEEYLKTQFEALSSRTLATRVIRALKLETDPRFVGRSQEDKNSKLSRWAQGVFHSFYPGKTVPVPEQTASEKERKFSPFAGAFAASVTVAPIKDSRVVLVSFDSPDPALAADALNTLASEYIQMNFETKYNATITASEFLAKQLIDLKAQVERSDAELVKFGQAHNIYTVGGKENVIMAKLSDLNSALTQAQAERIQRESVWKIARQGSPGQFPDILRSDDIRKLESNVADLQQQQARLRALYKPGWPEVKQIAGQLAMAEQQLANARGAALREVDTAYRTALQREKLLSEALTAQKSEADTLNQDSIQYSILKREVDSSKQIYDGMLQRMKEAGISAGLKSSNIHVVDPAEVPQAPYLPNTTANMLKALVGGLILGITLAFLMEHIDSYFDKSLKTPDDIDRFVKLPFLGLIPSVQIDLPSSRRKLLPLTIRKVRTAPNGSGTRDANGRHSAHSRPRTQDISGALVVKPANITAAVELVTHFDTKSLISEAYRDLRTSILLSASADCSPKSLLFTSSLKGEGKTTTCVNLAITLAQANEKVLLVDCDMRNPNVHRILGLTNTNGVSTFLSGTSANSLPLIQFSQDYNLFVFPAGRIPPNPSELIGSVRMKKCLLALSQHFDHVLIDSPPLLAVTDARILATLVDGVVLVIKGGETTKEAVGRSKRLLRDVRARILGTMLNNVNFHSSGSYYYSKYYYAAGSYESANKETAANAHAVH